MSFLSPLIAITIDLLREDPMGWRVEARPRSTGDYLVLFHPAGVTLQLEVGTGNVVYCNNLFPGALERIVLKRSVGRCLGFRVKMRYADLLLAETNDI